jgi:hypothetical protein
MSVLGFNSATRAIRTTGFAGLTGARGVQPREVRPYAGGASVVQLMTDIPANKPSYLSALSERERCP